MGRKLPGWHPECRHNPWVGGSMRVGVVFACLLVLSPAFPAAAETSAQAAFDAGAEAFRAEKFNEAEVRFREVIKADPKGTLAEKSWVNLGILAMSHANPEAAL